MEASFRLTEMIHMLVLNLANCFSWGKGREGMVCGSRPLQLVKQYQYQNGHGADSLLPYAIVNLGCSKRQS